MTDDLQLAQAQRTIARLRRALKPFAGRVYNDNGDVTYDTGSHNTDDYWNAYLAEKETR